MPDTAKDMIGGSSSVDLAGAQLLYRYSTGSRYRLDLGAETVAFSREEAPGKWTPPMTLPCRVRKIRDDLYLIHWLGPDRTIHVTLLFDIASRKVHVSALMPGKLEFFDVADIEEMTLPAARAAAARARG